MRSWTRFWYLWASAVVLNSYLAEAADAPFLPRTRGELQAPLEVFVLEKAIYELGCELNNRPAWVQVPIEGILQLMEAEG